MAIIIEENTIQLTEDDAEKKDEMNGGDESLEGSESVVSSKKDH